MSLTFAALLRQLQETHYPDSVKAFADALEIEVARVYRAMRPGGVPFDIHSCLKVALVTGADPLVVLRAGGKAHIADQLEALCEFRPMSPEMQALVDAASGLTAEQLQSLTQVVRHMEKRRPSGRPRSVKWSNAS